MATIILLLFVILISTIHELGHFGVLKLFDIKERKLKIGLGKSIYTKGWLSFGWFPLASYCSYDVQDFKKQPLIVRLLLYFSGIFANLLCVVVAMFLVVSLYGFTSTTVQESDSIYFEEGDIILKIHGDYVRTWLDLRDAVQYATLTAENDIHVLVGKGPDTLLVILDKEEDMFEGVQFATRKMEKVGDVLVPFSFVKEYFHVIIENAKRTLETPMEFIAADRYESHYTEPVSKSSIVQKLLPVNLIESAPSLSFKSGLIVFTMLSIWIILCNLIPLSVLDGGKALIDVVVTGFKLKINEDMINAVSAIVLMLGFAWYLMV